MLFGFAIVGVVDPEPPFKATRLAVCPTMAAAEDLVGTLPHAEDGRYYIDWCEETVYLDEDLRNG
jgi:hypothetical protein